MLGIEGNSGRPWQNTDMFVVCFLCSLFILPATSSGWVDGLGIELGIELSDQHSSSCPKYHLPTNTDEQARPWIKHLFHIIGRFILLPCEQEWPLSQLSENRNVSWGYSLTGWWKVWARVASHVHKNRKLQRLSCLWFQF